MKKSRPWVLSIFASFFLLSGNLEAATVQVVDSISQGYTYAEVFNYSSLNNPLTNSDSILAPETKMDAWSHAGGAGSAKPSAASWSTSNILASNYIVDDYAPALPFSSDGVEGLDISTLIYHSYHSEPLDTDQTYLLANQSTLSFSLDFVLLTDTIDWEYRILDDVRSEATYNFEVHVENITKSQVLLLATDAIPLTSTILSGDTGDIIRITTTGSMDFSGFTTIRTSGIAVDMSFGDYGTPAPAVVPIPAAAWLFGSGLIGLIGLARRKANA